MTDIAVNPATGDLDLTTGSIKLVTGADAIAQNIRIRLRFFLGEWFLDTRQGVPYFQKILGKKLNKNVVNQILKSVVLKTKGVKDVADFAQSFDGASRTLTVSFTATTDEGAVIVFNEPFIVGNK